MAEGQGFGERVAKWARGLKKETEALWFALRDPETPWYAKALGILVVGYAMSPIDLIPDFIPLLGYLDDIILLPLGLALLRRLVPEEVMGRAREEAARAASSRKPNLIAGAVVIFLWVLGLLILLRVLAGLFRIS